MGVKIPVIGKRYQRLYAGKRPEDRYVLGYDAERRVVVLSRKPEGEATWKLKLHRFWLLHRDPETVTDTPRPLGSLSRPTW